MPSFDRLLVFSVLALAASVLSAPVGTDRGHRGVLPASSANNVGGVVSGDIDDRDFDEQNTHHNNEDAGSSIHQRRAATPTTGKTTQKPRPTKMASPKSTKAKTAAKVTPTKPAKSTKVKATAKPTKSIKATTRPTKTTKTSNTASKASNGTAAAKPSACPIEQPAKKHRAFTSRAYDYVAHLFARDSAEFIGWHGTNSVCPAYLWVAIHSADVLTRKPPPYGRPAGTLRSRPKGSAITCP
ncbi:hypothetical protein GSI_04906 [Ganoderma sinense ZZ0214-1]|uniref:Uncharacterized protein n=1 Tax=Ganoderma sinense ZZ0214-1 TaxID=1077348 RepID=A0A2G8SG95_9APHY|nr:hypothetical protein GSI_04906 [Ganoderma sinense ZZ0214-1]